MKIRDLNDKTYIDSYEVITHREDIFSTSGKAFKEFKELESKFIIDGEISENIKKDTIFMDDFILDDGYVLDDVDYVRKGRISFENFSYVLAYNIVFKRNDKQETYVDFDNMIAYLKDKDDMLTINRVRKIAKSVKRTCRKMNNSMTNIRNATGVDPIEKYDSTEIASNVYKVKRM